MKETRAAASAVISSLLAPRPAYFGLFQKLPKPASCISIVQLVPALTFNPCNPTAPLLPFAVAFGARLDAWLGRRDGPHEPEAAE